MATTKKLGLSVKQVLHDAKLSNLPLTKQQADKFSTNLTSVLNYVDNINKLHTKEISETHQVTGLANIFRPDKIDKQKILTQSQALSNAQNTHQGYFVVKALI